MSLSQMKKIRVVTNTISNVKIEEGRLDLFSFSFSFYFFLIYFSIFRTTRVRVDQSRCHISHLMT